MAEHERGKLDQREYGVSVHERPRATAHAALNPDRYSEKPLSSGDIDLVSTAAQRSGAEAALATACISGGAVLALNRFSSGFRGALGLSGKLALVVTPTLGMFILKSHQTVADARADPEEFVRPHQQRAASAAAAAARAPRRSDLGLHHKLANFVYDSPFKTIIGIAVPAYSALFYRESINPQTRGMLLSQRLIHTRVYGQAAVVLTTIGVMGFGETMKAEGPYRIEAGRVVRGEPEGGTRMWYEQAGVGEETAEAEARRARQEEAYAAEAEQEGRSPMELMLPLVYVPAIAGIRFGLKGRVPPDRLNQVVLGAICVGLAHAGSVMFSDSTT